MRIEVDGVGIEVQVDGEGPAVVLLHGFPDSGRLWRNQVPALCAAGFRVVVPDLRGYGQSDKPDGVEQYHVTALAGDVVGLLDRLDIERAHVVGHDFGAALAWSLAAFAPDRVDRLVALSVGHPAAFREAGLEQREKSWYMLLFQFEGIAEQWLRTNDWEHLRRWSGHPDIDAVIDALERDCSLTPGLNWYRANVPPSSLVAPPLRFPPIIAPTMGVWSTGDIALLETQMRRSSDFVAAQWRYERIEGAGHWMQLDAPEALNALLLDFLKS